MPRKNGTLRLDRPFGGAPASPPPPPPPVSIYPIRLQRCGCCKRDVVARGPGFGPYLCPACMDRLTSPPAA